MLRYYLTIAVMLVIMLVQYRYYRHILAAPVIYPVMWILAFVGLIVAGDTYYEVSIGTCILFVAGYVLFSVGFRIAMEIKSRTSGSPGVIQSDGTEGTALENNTELGDQRLGLNIVTGICVLTGLAYAVILLKLIDFDDFYNSWLKLRNMLKLGEYSIPYILIILRYFIRCFLWYMSLHLFRIINDTDYHKEKDGYNARADLVIRILIILVSSVFIVIADFSRNDILFTFLPMLFIYILSRKLTNKRSIIFLFIGLIVFSIFFVWFTRFKRGTLNDDFDQEGARINFTRYLSGSLVALDVKKNSGNLKYFTLEGGRGVYTFSLISSLKDKIFETDDTPLVIRERIRVTSQGTTNVYTVYEWTGMDWGLLYALFCQLVYGLLYGFLFYGAVNLYPCSVFWYSALSYPLVMMFFQDQFFSIAQSWLIIITISFGIFFICNRTVIRIKE